MGNINNSEAIKGTNKMTREEVLDCLCTNDSRNPYYHEYHACEIEDGEPPQRHEKCFCDNCFKGRDALAQELLKHMPDDSKE